jgi:zeta-carotene isomerase
MMRLCQRSTVSLLATVVVVVVVTAVALGTSSSSGSRNVGVATAFTATPSMSTLLSRSVTAAAPSCIPPILSIRQQQQQQQQQQPFLVSPHDSKRSSSLFSFNDKNSLDNDVVVSSTSSASSSSALMGDDAAYFAWSEQNLVDWIKFSVATGTVLAAVAYAWFWPGGWEGGDVFLDAIQSRLLHSTDPAATVAAMLVVFAVCHSGLAGLRTYAEPLVGARVWRVVFAVVSLPLALSCISYFVNHAHEGVQLWDATHVPGIHTALFVANFVSFLFLYPSTFNLLEIAAIERPQLHLWETGIIRITRHPQAMGQVLWCIAHSIWLGTSTALAASAVLVAHHLYSVWHGDRRLATRHGEAFEYVKQKTSVIPFAAILDGRQELPPDYYKEFLRWPYAAVVVGTTAAYFAHPYMQAGAALLHW